MKRKATYLLALMAAVAAIFTMGAPVFASEADDSIVSSFNDSYVYKTYLKDDSIKAEAKDGVVTLTGTVADESNKALAENTAANLTGVTSVDNKLETKADVAADKAEKAGEKSDTWIGRKVKLALMFHRNVNGSKTTVEVKDGIVTLKGEAASMAAKELSAEYAKDIDGVKEVSNEMTVAATPEPAERTVAEKIDDASITAQVKVALTTHRSTSAIGTKIVTRDGEVTLTGIAKNDAEKALVTKLVTDIRGVTNVKNEMTVEEVKTQ